MVEVFITDIQDKGQAKYFVNNLSGRFPGLRINIDLKDSALPYPCGHSILRVEGTEIPAASIITALKESGFRCEVLEDKICQGITNTSKDISNWGESKEITLPFTAYQKSVLFLYLSHFSQ